MKNTSVIISTYTADVSGVCSALYELGGMVVIHDPSGCNSTYNTHDEPRWYDTDSLIFISGLSEIDAIMGSDDKLICDITRAARQLHPAFIALVQTPVPLLTGMDFYGIRDILEAETGLPVWFFPTSGMHSYIQGVNMALAAVARHLVPEEGKLLGNDPDDSEQIPGNSLLSPVQKPGEDPGSQPPLSINLLGVTPLDFSVNSSLDSVKKTLTSQGFTILSCFAMGSSREEIAQAGKADVNLVVSSAGLEAARVLKERFGIPYVVGLPTGAFAGAVAGALRESAGTREDILSYENTWLYGKNGYYNETIRPLSIYILGEPVITQSIREAVRMEYGISLKVCSCLEAPEELMDEGCVLLSSEEEIESALRDADVVAADPMYRPVCPKNARFIPFPHEAFSGRIYRKDIPDLTRAGEMFYTLFERRLRRQGRIQS